MIQQQDRDRKQAFPYIKAPANPQTLSSETGAKTFVFLFTKKTYAHKYCIYALKLSQFRVYFQNHP